MTPLLTAPPSPHRTDAPDPPAPAPKPRLRGWLHAATTPLVLAASIVVLTLADGPGAKAAMAVYLATSLILFGTSAAYHIGHWSPHVTAVLRRIDHSNIFLFIAGTYTPLSVLLLTGASRVALLSVIWSAAVAGCCFRILWLGAPRWLYVCLYIVMGWTAIWWMPQLWASGGPAVVGLVLAGGVAYSLGALVYARRWPNPIPRWYGFHEVFHSATILAAACHFTAIALAIVR